MNQNPEFKSKAIYRIPESLYLTKLFESNNIKFTNIFIEKCHFFIDWLNLQGHIIKAKELDYINVNYNSLAQYLGWRDAARVKESLLAVGVIESDGLYRLNVKSFGYRFSVNYQGPFRKVDVMYPNFAARIALKKARRKAARVMEGTPQHYIANCHNRLQIDDIGATNFAEATYVERKLERRRYSIEMTKNKDWICTLDAQGRLYTNIVMMPRDIRKFVTLDNEPMYQSDYSSLQPALLVMLYPSECAEKEKFIKVIRNGFYAFLAARYSKPYDLKNESEKSEFKELVFSHFLFCENRVQSEMRRIFEAEFPILSACIVAAKRTDFAALPKRLQAIEAEIVIQTVIPRLMKRCPGLPVLSIHDCVATTKRYVGEVEEEMKRAFLEKTGFEVPVKTSRVTRNEMHGGTTKVHASDFYDDLTAGAPLSAFSLN